MNIKERIINYLSNSGISVTRAEVVLGWSKGALLKANSISSDRVGEFLLRFEDLSAEWLLRGEGEMLKFSSSNNTAVDSSLVENLKAEINQLKGENRVLREQAGLGERKDGNIKSA